MLIVIMSKNTTVVSIDTKFDVLVVSKLINQAFLHYIWADIAWFTVLVCLLLCFVCERDCRLCWKVWKRMGFRFYML